MANVIFDTNIYIYHHLQYPPAIETWRQYVKTHDVLMSMIQVSELLSYPKVDDHPDIMQQREEYISLADEMIMVDEHIARKAAELRRAWKKHSGKGLKLPDALIAATAILNGALLISNNDRDFLYLSQYHGLNYFNPIQNQDDLYRFVAEKKKTDVE